MHNSSYTFIGDDEYIVKNLHSEYANARNSQFKLLDMNIDTSTYLYRNMNTMANVNESFYSTWRDMNSVYAYIDNYIGEKARQKSICFYKNVIGNTFEKRAIFMYFLSNDCKKEQVVNMYRKKRSVFVTCTLHAREWISPLVCTNIVENLVRHDNILSIYDVYIVPISNPDGYEYTWTSKSHNAIFWRKNRQKNPNCNCFGIDLNRNFGAYFSKKPVDACCSYVYGGQFAYEANEVAAIKQIMNKLSYMTFHVDIHSYGGEILGSYGGTYKKLRHDSLYNSIGTYIARKMSQHNPTMTDDNERTDEYNWVPAGQFYLAPGCINDDVEDNTNALSFTFEMYPSRKYANSMYSGFHPELSNKDLESHVYEGFVGVKSLLESGQFCFKYMNLTFSSCACNFACENIIPCECTHGCSCKTRGNHFGIFKRRMDKYECVDDCDTC